MKDVFNKYMNDKIKLDKYQKIGIICLLIAISGFFGWVYEFIFYYFNDGKFTFQGGNFLPWINIYAYGALIIVLTTFKLKKHPIKIFLLSMISTGLLEYFSGYFIYKIGNGARYWNYNTEILNFGNIGGFVCFRSVTFFGLSALLLMYIIVPLCIYISKKMNRKTFLTISIIICFIFLIDEVYNLMISKVFELPYASQVYKRIGIK